MYCGNTRPLEFADVVDQVVLEFYSDDMYTFQGFHLNFDHISKDKVPSKEPGLCNESVNALKTKV